MAELQRVERVDRLVATSRRPGPCRSTVKLIGPVVEGVGVGDQHRRQDRRSAWRRSGCASDVARCRDRIVFPDENDAPTTSGAVHRRPARGVTHRASRSGCRAAVFLVAQVTARAARLVEAAGGAGRSVAGDVGGRRGLGSSRPAGRPFARGRRCPAARWSGCTGGPPASGVQVAHREGVAERVVGRSRSGGRPSSSGCRGCGSRNSRCERLHATARRSAVVVGHAVHRGVVVLLVDLGSA